MRWLKLFTLSSVLFISAVIFGSQPTYAISYSYTPIIDSADHTFDLTDVPFTPAFIRFDFDYSNASTFQQVNFWAGVSSNGYSSNPWSTSFDQTISRIDVKSSFKPTTIIMPYPVLSGSSPVYRINPVFPANFSVQVSMSLLDSLDCPECDCPDCPVVPDDSQTLLDIKKAIYTIPAVLLVIYFFYIMFGWYLGGRQ